MSESAFNNYLSSLAEASRGLYRKRTDEYKSFCVENDLNPSEVSSLDTYLELLHSDEYDFAASTCWNICSILSTWFENVNKIRPLNEYPALKKKLKNWTKQETQKKAANFTKEEVNKFLNDAPDDSKYLWRKVALAIAIYGFTCFTVSYARTL